ncbi:threonylcarbamoyl-AMP synthase [Patescibacteria group bacterium]|nr:threonylcarbamoyl-AMP synthase [Patescibacteria group bacterium]MBU2259188.1 threonylcarbamoyl-AMP synthase [Patescibacteria group bacterium]
MKWLDGSKVATSLRIACEPSSHPTIQPSNHMQILTPSEAAINVALQTLEDGGIVAHATETCYGLACDMTNPEAVEKLFLIKERNPNQPISALFPTVEATEGWVEWNDEARELAAKELPGPLTIVLPCIKEEIFPTSPLHYSTTLGIRVSSHPIAKELSEKFGKPISTTSANVSGEPCAYSAENIIGQFKDKEHKPDLILDSGQLEERSPSKVVSFIKDEPQVLRY